MFCFQPGRVAIDIVTAVAFAASIRVDPHTEKPNLLPGRELRETSLDVGEDLQGSIELTLLVGRHQAGPQERATGRHPGWIATLV